MKDRYLLNRKYFLFTAVFALMAGSIAAATPNFAGEFADRKFLNGRAVFQMSLEQTGSSVKVWFSTGYNDGHGTAPEADGTGSINSQGVVEFRFTDSDNNAGSGTISRTGDDVILTIRTTRVADKRCLDFYKAPVRLERQVKK